MIDKSKRPITEKGDIGKSIKNLLKIGDYSSFEVVGSFHFNNLIWVIFLLSKI